MKYVVVKMPDMGDVSKSAKFFESLTEGIEYADGAPYPNMAVAIVLQEDNWCDRLLVWLARRAISKRNNGSKIPAVS